MSMALALEASRLLVAAHDGLCKLLNSKLVGLQHPRLSFPESGV